MNNAELDKLRATFAKKHDDIREILNCRTAHRLNGLIYYDINCKFIFLKVQKCVCLC